MAAAAAALRAAGGLTAPAALVHRKVWARELQDARVVVWRPRTASFLFGRPTAELLCVRALGVVVAAEVSGEEGKTPGKTPGKTHGKTHAYHVDDGSGVLRVVCPAALLAARAGPAPRVGDLVDFCGRLRPDEAGRGGGARHLLATGFDVKADCMWEALRMAEAASLYASHYFAETRGVVVPPRVPQSAAAARAAALDDAAAAHGRRAAKRPLAVGGGGALGFEVVSPEKRRRAAERTPAAAAAAVDPEAAAAAVARGSAGGVTVADLCRDVFPGRGEAGVAAAVGELILAGRVYEKDGRLFPL